MSKKIKLIICLGIALCFGIIFNIKVIKNEYGKFTIIETIMNKYASYSITLNDNPYFESISAAVGNAVSGETIYVEGELTVNEDVNIPKGITVHLKANSTLTISAKSKFEVAGTFIAESTSFINVSGNIDLKYDSTFDTSGAIMFYGTTAKLTTAPQDDCVTQYANMILRNGSSFLGDSAFVNTFSDLSNISIDNYGANITDNDVITLFNSSNIINSHGLHVIGTETYYDSFNEVPANSNIELTTFLYLTENQTIASGVTINVLENKQVYIDGNLTINGTLTMNDNILTAKTLSGSGKIYLTPGESAQEYNTYLNDITNSINIYVQGTPSYGQSLITFNPTTEKYLKNGILLNNINLKSALTNFAISEDLHNYNVLGDEIDGKTGLYIAFTYDSVPDKYLYDCILDAHYALSNTGDRPESYNSKLSNTELAKITNLTCNTYVQYSTGIELLTNLEVLNLNNNIYLSTLDLSNNTKLKELYIKNIGISTASYSPLTILEKLDISSNNIATLDISNTKLKYINASNAGLKSLVNNNVTTLEELYLSNNNLSSLDLSNNNNIKILNAKNNNISSIKISPTDKLQEIQITRSANFEQTINNTIDFSNATNLKSAILNYLGLKNLNINSNVLEELDVSSNSLETATFSSCNNLGILTLSNNSISSLDLNKCSSLVNVDISNNNISNLIMSNTNTLTDLIMNNNKLTSFDFSGFNNLYLLDVTNNKFKSLDLSRNTTLYFVDFRNNEFVTDIYLSKEDITNSYKLELSNSSVKLPNSIASKLTLVEGENDIISINKGLNTHDVTYAYEVAAPNGVRSEYVSSTLDMQYNVYIPKISTTKYILDEETQAIYIYDDTTTNILNNITIEQAVGKINSDKLEIRHFETDENPVDTYQIIGISNENADENNLIKITERTTVREAMNKFNKVGLVSIVAFYSNGEEVISENDIVKTGMTFKMTYKNKVYETYSFEAEYIDLTNVVIDETNHIIKNLVLGTKISEFEALLDTTGTFTYYDQTGSVLALKQDDLIMTGLKVKIELTSNTYEYTLSVKGDVTETGESTISDVMRIIDHSLTDNKLTEIYQLEAADVNNDGVISISDVMKLVDQLLS